MSANESRCDGVTRRDFLHLGLLSAFGLSTTDLFQYRALGANKSGKDLSCILIWLDGGPTHLDTFDPKPNAPVEVRGPFETIRTDVPGIRLSEHMKETAKVMKDVALIRSLTHELGNHDTGSHYLLTGHRPSPVIKYPSLGSVVAKETGFEKALPPYIAVPSIRSVGKSGYLPGTYSPFDLGGDPSRPNYKVRDLNPPEWLSFDRVDRRRNMQAQVDNLSRVVEQGAATETRDSFYEQAYRLLTSPAAKHAFDLSKEKPQTRQRYGRRRIGTGCLMARRLIEAGSRFVTVVDRGWDTHQDLARNLPDARFPGSGKLPDMDRAFATLVSDLKERGLLDTTLVIMMGEFGRTPKINARGGRDHWPRAGFACFAGGGVKGGQVIGATDNYGETPADRPVRPEDIATTVLTMMGIDPRHEYETSTGRPMKIQAEGGFISELV